MVHGRRLWGFRVDRHNEYFASLITFLGTQTWYTELGTFQTGCGSFFFIVQNNDNIRTSLLYLFIKLLKFVREKLISFLRLIMFSLSIMVLYSSKTSLLWSPTFELTQNILSNTLPHLGTLDYKVPQAIENTFECTYKLTSHHCTKLAIGHSHLRVNLLIWCS